MAKQALQQLASFAALILFASANFIDDTDVTWGSGRGKILENGNLLQLTLDMASGSGFQSKQEYLFGRIDMKIKLVPGNSAGTVTTLYLSSQGPKHDEIDFEFLGNVSEEPYIVHTNVYTQGKGNREQQFYLWFDPRADFHTYSLLWNPQQILFYVDGTPIRVFKNAQASGVPYPKDQPMRLYSSLWDAEDWATRGGLVKTDWANAPFIASYRNFNSNACVWSEGEVSCSATKAKWWDQYLDASGAMKLNWVRKNYMIYDYCQDKERFPQGLPPEWSLSP